MVRLGLHILSSKCGAKLEKIRGEPEVGAHGLHSICFSQLLYSVLVQQKPGCGWYINVYISSATIFHISKAPVSINPHYMAKRRNRRTKSAVQSTKDELFSEMLDYLEPID